MRKYVSLIETIFQTCMTYTFTRFRLLWIVLMIIGVVIAMSYINIENHAEAFHSKEELDYFKLRANMDLPLGGNALFKASGECSGCHGSDITGFASVDSEGNDINVSDDWRATMMANSAKDPFWRAKVSHEVLVNPAHQIALEDKCHILPCSSRTLQFEIFG